MNKIERDWTTEAGLRAVCLLIVREDGTRSHRCGYVCLAPGHPLHGVAYNAESPSLKEVLERLKVTPVAEIEHLHSFSRMLGMLSGEFRASADCVFSVHGGITFSSDEAGEDYPAKSDDGWWYGFDCIHCDDAYIDRDKYSHKDHGTARSESYVIRECESLAQQLAGVA